MLADAVLNGLRVAQKKLGTKTAVADRARVNQGALIGYINGKKNVAAMTVATFEKLLPILDDVHVVYGALPRERLPVDLAPLVDTWERLPAESREHILFVIEAVLERHGLGADADRGRGKKAEGVA